MATSDGALGGGHAAEATEERPGAEAAGGVGARRKDESDEQHAGAAAAGGVGAAATLSLSLVTLDDAMPLRKSVLRPWITPEMNVEMYGGGGKKPNFHVGAAAPSGELVCVAGLVREAHDGGHGVSAEAFGPPTAQWRLCGMATAPELQRRGIGGRALEFGAAEVARRLRDDGHGCGTLWCRGRTSASTFYERHGFQAVGDLFVTPQTGPHYIYWRTINAPARLS